MNTEYEVLGQRLKTRQDELRQRVASIARDVTRRAAADWSEQAQERENDEVLDALGNEAMTELRLIQKALERMEVGDYGVCTGCGGSIPMARLEIMPYTNLCVKCAESQE